MGNVPGNKDSGVVEDDIQHPTPVVGLKSSDTYADMSHINTDRDSSLDIECEYDVPPPCTHSTSKKYVNFEKDPPPVAHIPSRPKLSRGESGSDTGSVYLDMAGKSAPIFTQSELSHEHYSHDAMHRTKSESGAKEKSDEYEEDYEVPDDFEELGENVSFDLQSIHSSSSLQDNMSVSGQQYNVPELQMESTDCEKIDYSHVLGTTEVDSACSMLYILMWKKRIKTNN